MSYTEVEAKVKKAEQNTIFHNENICHKNCAIINAIGLFNFGLGLGLLNLASASTIDACTTLA